MERKQNTRSVLPDLAYTRAEQLRQEVSLLDWLLMRIWIWRYRRILADSPSMVETMVNLASRWRDAADAIWRQRHGRSAAQPVEL